MWINDVVSLQVISSVDHNNRRNRLVQTFDTTAERDNHTAALPDGAVCYVTAGDAVYVKRGGAWRYLVPVGISAVGVATAVVGAVPIETARLDFPPGYTAAHVTYMAQMSAPTTPGAITATSTMLLNGSTTIAQQQLTVMTWSVMAQTTRVAIGAAGGTFTVNTSAVGGGSVNTYAGAHVHQLSAVLLP